MDEPDKGYKAFEEMPKLFLCGIASQSHTTWDAGGSVSILVGHSAVNAAAMQALGSYKGGKMLFLGLGTGLGSTIIVDGIVEPMELGHLPYKKGTYKDYVGRQDWSATERRNGGVTSPTSWLPCLAVT